MSRPKSSYTLWIMGHVLRGLFALLIFSVCAFLIWRVAFSQKPPKQMRSIGTNEVLRAALEEHDTLTMITQKTQVSYTEASDNQAYFRYDWCVFIEEADQVQLLFFYNNSTLEKVQSEQGLAQELPRGEAVFDVVLTQYVDVSPEGHTGDPVSEKKAFSPTCVEVDTNRNGMYTFIRYTFDGVDLADTLVIYLDVYYAQLEESLGTLRLYHTENRTEVRELERKEEKIIRGE